VIVAGAPEVTSSQAWYSRYLGGSSIADQVRFLVHFSNRYVKYLHIRPLSGFLNTVCEHVENPEKIPGSMSRGGDGGLIWLMAGETVTQEACVSQLG